LSQVHWSVSAWPNVAFGASGTVVSFMFWKAGSLAPDPFIAGVLVGVLEGALDLLGRRRNLPHLRRAETFGAAIFAYRHSPWTRAKDLIALACLVVIGLLVAGRVEQPGYYTAVSMFLSFAAVSFLLRALVLAPWGESDRLPSNTSLERTREG
jgi:hypothetical protein